MSEKEVKVFMKRCPLCGRPSISAHSITEMHGEEFKSALWYECICGIIYQKETPIRKIQDQEYLDKYDRIKEYEDIAVQQGRTYAPIIEACTYGRKLLDVGFGVKHNQNFFKKRGWITFGIDNNNAIKTDDRTSNDDFEQTTELYQNDFDCVWMSHVLEQFNDPFKAIRVAYEILQTDGIIFISTPDIDILKSHPPPLWQYWKLEEHYIMWSERALCRELERVGFNIILKKRNISKRYGYYDDIHIIAQKYSY